MKTTKNNDARANGDWQGMNWIRQEKRLAIYLRDGCACTYCGESVERGAKLTLDHLTPHSKGGSNGAENLVTCCSKCNSSRGTRSVAAFARATAAYMNHGVKAEDIIRHIRNCAARSLAPHKIEAAALVSRRGSASKALAAF